MKAVIFDLYGTLVYVDHSTHPYRTLLAKQASAHAIQGLMTSDAKDTLKLARAIGAELSPEDARALDQQAQDEASRIRVFEEVPEVLKALKAQGMTLIVSSNLARLYGHAKVLLDGYIDYWNFSYETGLLKPDPSMFLGPARAYGLAPQDCLVVGDSLLADGKGAQAAGMPFLLLDRYDRHPTLPAVRDLTGLTGLPTALDSLPLLSRD